MRIFKVLWNRRVLSVWLLALVVVEQHAIAHQGPPGQFDSFAGLFAAVNTPAVTAFHAISNYTQSLPLPVLRNGIVYQGGSGRLRRVVKQLLEGKPTHFGVIGGSASYGVGVQRGSSDWFAQLQRYIRTAFPRAAVTAKNGCVPGGQSEFVNACLDKFVSRDADLIFVEFATSDGYLDTSVNNGYVHSFERLVRKLLQLPNRPAVVVANFLHAGASSKGGLPFFHTIEDHYGVIAQYYQLPWLSFRDAVWHGMTNNWQGFRAEELFMSPEGAHPHHPSELGHSYMADLAVGLLQQTYLELMLQPLTQEDMAISDTIPAPMFRNNFEAQGSACATGIDLKAAVTAQHADWHFVNEGNSHKLRWGFVSQTPKSVLELQLDTRAASPQAIPQLTLQQKVHILKQHGMFAAASQLQASQAHLRPIPTTLPTAAVPGQLVAAADGMQAASKEAQRQAAAAAQMLQSGQLQQQQQQFGARERLIGGQGGGFQLPSDAREVAASTTATGVEVVMKPQPGRKLRHQPPAAQAAAAYDFASRLRRTSAAFGGSSTTGANTSSSSGSRLLLGAAAALTIPPPTDAVYLKPGADSSILTTLGARANSVAQADMLVWIGYQRSHRMMGQARLHCISGCVCQDVVVDAWHEPRVSHMAMAKLRVTQHAECRIGVEILQQSSSGHHKFRVAAVLVSRAVEYQRISAVAHSSGTSGVVGGSAGGAAAAAVNPDVAMMSALEAAGPPAGSMLLGSR